MKSTVSSLKRALREAFVNKLRDLDHDSHTEPLFTQFRSTEMGVDDVTNRHNAIEPPEISVKVGSDYSQDDGEPDGMEDESTSRERQQAAGYSGAVDGPMDYGYDMSPKEEHSEEMTGEMPFDAGSVDFDLDLSDDEQKEEEPESELSMNKILKGEELDDDEDSEQDKGDDSDEEDSEDNDEEDSDESEESSDDDSDGEDDEDSEEDSEDDDDSEVEEEGVSQSKRAIHGYDLEDPDDYRDQPTWGPRGHSLGEGAYDMDEMDSDGTNVVPGSGDGIGEDMGDNDQKNFPELSGLRNALKSVKPQDLSLAMDLASSPAGSGKPPFSNDKYANFAHDEYERYKARGNNPSRSPLSNSSNQMGEDESPVSQQKAKTIMKHGEVGGKPLTDKQKGLFGLISGGGKPTRMKK